MVTKIYLIKLVSCFKYYSEREPKTYSVLYNLHSITGLQCSVMDWHISIQEGAVVVLMSCFEMVTGTDLSCFKEFV